MNGHRRFRNRADAGRRLAMELSAYADRDDVVVLALPRGGVPVGYEIAEVLGAPLDVFLVHKLGAPGAPELAMGAVATGGIRVVNEQVVQSLGISREVIDEVARREEAELHRRGGIYRARALGEPELPPGADPPPPVVEGKVCLLVDDGLATGSTMLAAIRALRQMSPGMIVAAVPVAPPETCQKMRAEADEVVCLMTPPLFASVGQWYEDFEQLTDEDVRRLLVAAMAELGAAHGENAE